jgi:hypothetical protein
MTHQYPANGGVRSDRALAAHHYTLGEVFPTLGVGQSESQAGIPTNGTPRQADVSGYRAALANP